MKKFLLSMSVAALVSVSPMTAEAKLTPEQQACLAKGMRALKAGAPSGTKISCGKGRFIVVRGSKKPKKSTLVKNK